MDLFPLLGCTLGVQFGCLVGAYTKVDFTFYACLQSLRRTPACLAGNHLAPIWNPDGSRYSSSMSLSFSCMHAAA